MNLSLPITVWCTRSAGGSSIYRQGTHGAFGNTGSTVSDRRFLLLQGLERSVFAWSDIARTLLQWRGFEAHAKVDWVNFGGPDRTITTAWQASIAAELHPRC